jgi:palmitoyltransferase ZDHHC9/14/18
MELMEVEGCLTVASILLQVFFLRGRFIFGPDARSLFVTMFLIMAPVSIFCAFVARELMDNFSYGLGLPVMIAAVLFTAYVSTILRLSDHYLH